MLTGEKKAEKRGDSTVVKMGEKPGAEEQERRPRRARSTSTSSCRREKTDKIFVVLAEFGNERHPNYPDQDTDPNTVGPVKFDGPLHNEIPEPDRSKDNSTIWQADYSREHFQDLYFSDRPGRRLGRELLRRSSPPAATPSQGYVTDWVKVRYNEARYGRSNGYPCAGNVCSNSYSSSPTA